MSNKFDTKWLNKIETELIFKVNIEITDMYNKNNHKVPKEKWLKNYTC